MDGQTKVQFVIAAANWMWSATTNAVYEQTPPPHTQWNIKEARYHILRHGVRRAMFTTYKGEEVTLLTQSPYKLNPDKSLKWTSRLVRDGHQLTWVITKNEYTGRVQDGKWIPNKRR